MRSKTLVIVGTLVVAIALATALLDQFAGGDENADLLWPTGGQESLVEPTIETGDLRSDAGVPDSTDLEELHETRTQENLHTIHFISAGTGFAIDEPTEWEIFRTSNPLTRQTLEVGERGVVTCTTALGDEEWGIRSLSPGWAAVSDRFRASYKSSIDILVARLGVGRIRVVDTAYRPISGALVGLRGGVHVDPGKSSGASTEADLEELTGADGVAEFLTLIDPLACTVWVTCVGYAPVACRFAMEFELESSSPAASLEVVLEAISAEALRSVSFEVRGDSNPGRWTLLGIWSPSERPLGWPSPSVLGTAALGQAVTFPEGLDSTTRWAVDALLSEGRLILEFARPQGAQDRDFALVMNRLSRCTFRLPAAVAEGVGIRNIDARCSGRFLNLEAAAYCEVRSSDVGPSSKRSIALGLPSESSAKVVAYLTDGRVATAELHVTGDEMTVDLEGAPEGATQDVQIVCSSPLLPVSSVSTPSSDYDLRVLGGPLNWSMEVETTVQRLRLRIADGFYVVARRTRAPGSLEGGLDLDYIQCEERSLRFIDTANQVLPGLEFSFVPTSLVDHASAAMFQWRPSGSAGYEVQLRSGVRFRTGRDGVALVRVPVGSYRVLVGGRSGGRVESASRGVMAPVDGVVVIGPGDSRRDVVVERTRQVAVELNAEDGRALDTLHWCLLGANAGRRRDFYGARGSFRWNEQAAELKVLVGDMETALPVVVPGGAESIVLQVTIP